jgi:hypothetical protein
MTLQRTVCIIKLAIPGKQILRNQSLTVERSRTATLRKTDSMFAYTANRLQIQGAKFNTQSVYSERLALLGMGGLRV